MHSILSVYENPTQIGDSRNIIDAFKFHEYGFGYNGASELVLLICNGPSSYNKPSSELHPGPP